MGCELPSTEKHSLCRCAGAFSFFLRRLTCYCKHESAGFSKRCKRRFNSRTPNDNPRGHGQSTWTGGIEEEFARDAILYQFLQSTQLEGCAAAEPALQVIQLDEAVGGSVQGDFDLLLARLDGVSVH